MSEYVVKVLDREGRTLRRFVTFARNLPGALRRGYEAADTLDNAADVIAVPV